MQNVVLFNQQNAPVQNAVPNGDGAVLPMNIAVLDVKLDLELAALTRPYQFPQTTDAALV